MFFFVLAMPGLAGAILSPWGVLIPLALTLGAVWVAALALAVTSRIHEIDHYNFFFAAFFSYLWVSGAYFPLENMPAVVQFAVRLIPVTSAIEITRDLMVGRTSFQL
jgi:lipooligosaccharide transport system permease protein